MNTQDADTTDDSMAADMDSADQSITEDMDPTDPGCPVERPTRCGDECVDTSSDPEYCGSCARSCGSAETCSAGECMESTGNCVVGGCMGFSWCDPTDGTCKRGCSTDDQCANGENCDTESHTCQCATGLRQCNGSCVPEDSPLGCGASCTVCPTDENGQAVCSNGQCGLDCGEGFLECNGTCAACPTTGGITALGCEASACVAQQCDEGFQLCEQGCCPDMNTMCPTAVGVARLLAAGGAGTTNLGTIPLKTIELDGTGSMSSGGPPISRYEWSVIQRPNQSSSMLTPSSAVSKPTFFLDLAGTYKFQLRVYNRMDVVSCNQATVTVTATHDEDLSIQLVWSTPSDSDQTDTRGTDFDLHYLLDNSTSRWDTAPYDIFWRNKEADWGVVNDSSDDPSLDIDDTDGAGPENINHDNVPDGSYLVGVYFYNENGYGASYATVRIFINGSLAWEYLDRYIERETKFWLAARIDWSNGMGTVTNMNLNTVTDGFPSR